MLTLSSDGLARFDAALRALMSPLAYPDPDAWRADVCETARAFVGGDAALAGVPGAGAFAYSPHLDAGVIAGIKRFLESPTLGEGGSPDPEVNVVYAELLRTGLDVVDFGYIDRIIGGRLYTSPSYTEVFGPAGLRDMRTLYVPTRAGGRPALSGLALYARQPVSAREGARRMQRLRMLKPAFEAGVDALGRLRAARAALDAVAEPLAAFDGDGRERHRTPALERLLGDDPQRAHVDAAVAALAGRTAAFVAPRPGRGGGGRRPVPAFQTVTTARGRYALRTTLLAESPFGGEAAVLVTTVREDASALPSAETVQARHGLSPREAEVALLLAEGLVNGAVAERLCISPHTVRRHTEAVMRKLLVETRAAVARRLLAPG